MSIITAYWLTLAFPLVYCIIWMVMDGDLTTSNRGDYYARVAKNICLVVLVVGALVGIWMSALIPGLY